MTSQAHSADGRWLVALIVFLGLTAGGLAGCGSTSKNSITTPPRTPANITGNWQFTATINGGGNVPIAAYLTSAGGVASGTADVEMAFPTACPVNGCCGGPFASFNPSLTGIIDANNNLTLGSAVQNGGPVFTMTGTVSGGTLTNGSFTLTGLCPAQGTITGTEYPTLNGTYAGTLTSQTSGQNFAVSATFDQSATLNSRGFFNVDGTVNFTGYPCMTSAAVATPLDMNSGFLGNNFTVTMNAVPGGDLIVIGTLSPDGKTLTVTYFFILMGSSCNNDTGTGLLMLQ
ncbi:MAG: hypothetical protein ABR990_13310 [Terracidiphilus sp.]|jgi:hypothetical protein